MEKDDLFLAQFKSRLQDIGYTRPRMKLLPSLKIGAESLRDKGYQAFEWVTEEMMAGYDLSHLLCHNGRIVSDRGGMSAQSSSINRTRNLAQRWKNLSKDTGSVTRLVLPVTNSVRFVQTPVPRWSNLVRRFISRMHLED
jgi:hypothetical protein